MATALAPATPPRARAAEAAALAAQGSASSVPMPVIAVPRFIDPHLHIDKPDLSDHAPVRILTTDDDPPFSFPGPDGTPTGYNVDLARAVCATLGVTCTIEVRRFEALMPALEAGAADAAAGSLAITAGSRAAVDFSLPTMRMTARFAGRLGHLPAEVRPESTERLVVGVQGNTAHEAFLRRFFPRAVPKVFGDPDSLRAALRTGAVDLIFADGLSLALWVNGSASSGCCGFAGGPYTNDRYFGEGTGIAVRKNDTALCSAFDWALQRLAADGTMADLYLKYVPNSFW